MHQSWLWIFPPENPKQAQRGVASFIAVGGLGGAVRGRGAKSPTKWQEIAFLKTFLCISKINFPLKSGNSLNTIMSDAQTINKVIENLLNKDQTKFEKKDLIAYRQLWINFLWALMTEEQLCFLWCWVNISSCHVPFPCKLCQLGDVRKQEHIYHVWLIITTTHFAV